MPHPPKAHSITPSAWRSTQVTDTWGTRDTAWVQLQACH